MLRSETRFLRILAGFTVSDGLDVDPEEFIHFARMHGVRAVAKLEGWVISISGQRICRSSKAANGRN